MKLVLIVISALCLWGCDGDTSSDVNSSSNSSGPGQSGSLASMVIAGDELHILKNDTLKSFDLSGELLVQDLGDAARFWQAETLMNYQNKYLLIGTDTGVIVYDFKNNEELSRVNHIEAFDPVTAQGTTGYFTTRSGNERLQTQQDTVNIIDLSNIEDASLVFTSELLSEPLGLAVYNNELFVCDLASGLSRFEIVQEEGEVATELVYISSDANLPCNDIIVRDDLIILVHSGGATQFTMVDNEITILSEIY